MILLILLPCFITIHRIFLPFIGFSLPFMDLFSFLAFFVRTFEQRQTISPRNYRHI